MSIVLIFYGTILLLVFLFRKKFEMHGIVALYRTKIGLKSMDKIAAKYREYVRLLGFIGIGAGYIGLIVISVMLFKNFYDLIIIPTTVSAVAPVIPGVRIPGTGLTVPLIAGWISLFIVILVHEFSHGVVARAHDMKVKSSGLFFMGPLMGAFVEPDEPELRKSSDVAQYSILAAGPFSNMLLTGVIILLFLTIVPFSQSILTDEKGFILQSVQDEFPAKSVGLQPEMVITAINDNPVINRDTFIKALEPVKPGDTITIIANQKSFDLTTTSNPNNNNAPFLGVSGSTHQMPSFPFSNLLYPIYKWIIDLLYWTGALSLGIGLINLFPIFITDGARMLQVSFLKLSKNNGLKIWKHTNIACLLVLFLSLFIPLFRWLV